jgi:hypothetical protein
MGEFCFRELATLVLRREARKDSSSDAKGASSDRLDAIWKTRKSFGKRRVCTQRVLSEPAPSAKKLVELSTRNRLSFSERKREVGRNC